VSVRIVQWPEEFAADIKDAQREEVNRMKKIAILGSTGSIGTQTLETVRKSLQLQVVGLAAGSNVEKMEEQIREFHPSVACMWEEQAAAELRGKVADLNVKIVSGMDGLLEIAVLPQSQVLVTAIVGMIGIRPTIAAIEAGKDIALANKETLVTAGHIIMPLARQHRTAILPVDSEHSAIFQSLKGEWENPPGLQQTKDVQCIEKILLTASGGPFRGKSRQQLEQIKPEDALKHPNWTMGRKVTIDSSTLVNKGLEVMEAKWLFDVELDQIEVVIHPQSIVHSAVQFADGAIIAQLGVPDMKLPIQYALFYPERKFMEGKRVDLFELGQLTFEKPDTDTFPGLALAFQAARAGGSMPTVYNAANEKAVALFLEHRLSYPGIAELIRAAMEEHRVLANPTVEEILETERQTYEFICRRF
jgi:1-deoxy-D-xylulose-5-phosphate reductoisomerase